MQYPFFVRKTGSGSQGLDDVALMKSVILKKTISVAAREGVRGFSVKSVASEAGCSEGLIFHYYSTKKELTDTCYRYIADEFSKNAVSYESDLPSLLRYFCDYMKENKEIALFTLEYIQQEDDPVGFDIIIDAVRGRYADEGEDFYISISRSVMLFGCLIGSGKLRWKQPSSGDYKTILNDMTGWMVSGLSQDDKDLPPA